MSLQPHTSVYISNRTQVLAAYHWCTQVIGPSVYNRNVQQLDVMWTFTCVDSGVLWAHDTTTHVFSFVNSRHKLLFDLAWGHLGIYDSVAQLQAAGG